MKNFIQKLNKNENKNVGVVAHGDPKGITLISLVITIVVLIILAGVAINMTLGENGIFTKAQEAKRMQAIATANEKIGLEILTAQMEALERDESLEQEQLEDIISKYGALQADGDTIILNDNGYETSLLDIYKGTTTTSGSYTENKAKLELLEGQVELLQQQKGENEARIALLESEVELLERQKADLQQQLEDLASSGGDQAQKIVELTTQIQTLEQEKNTLEQNLIVANAKVEEYEALKELLKETTVTANKILEDYKAYIDGEIIKGTMPNNGGVTKTINAGESYTIPQGYHNGTGVITASTLESQTSGTATEDKILKGYTAYKDGKLIKGTMENYAGKTVSASTITESGENALITIPQNGYYSTSSKISIPVSEMNGNLDDIPENPTFLTGQRTNVINNAVIGHTYAILDVAHGGNLNVGISSGATLITTSAKLQSAADNGYYNVTGMILCVATDTTIVLNSFVYGSQYQNVIALDLGTLYQ